MENGMSNFRKQLPRELLMQLTALNRRDNYHGIFAVIEDYGIIAAACLLTKYFPLAYPITILIIGARQRALATLLHEASHRTLASNLRLVQFLGSVLSGWLVFQTYFAYVQSHVIKHHQFLGHPHNDPDEYNKINQGLYEVASGGELYRNHLFPLLFGVKLVPNLLNLLRDRLLPQSESSKEEKYEFLAFLVFWLVIVSAATVTGLIFELLLFWLIPYFTAFQAINWIVELCEHFPAPKPGSDPLEMARNRQSGLVEKFFFGIHQENYHLLHHLFPGIPFWNLPKAHRELLAYEPYAIACSESGGIFSAGYAQDSIISEIRRKIDGNVGLGESLNG